MQHKVNRSETAFIFLLNIKYYKHNYKNTIYSPKFFKFKL